MTRYVFAIHLLWLFWLTIWVAAARWTARTEAEPERRANAVHGLVTLAGFIALFFVSRRPFPITTPLWPVSPTLGWAMVALMVAAIAFGCWARIVLGRLWSGTVTRKEDHRIVETGPYRLVRHPIYTALITAAIATAVVKASPLAILGAFLMTVGLTVKARLEERFLSAELGEDSYRAYRGRVPMLVPFAPTRMAS